MERERDVCVLKTRHGSAPVSGILNRRERKRSSEREREMGLLFRSAAVRRAGRETKTEMVMENQSVRSSSLLCMFVGEHGRRSSMKQIRGGDKRR